MIVSLAFLLYFFCLLLFSLISQPVYYCVLLIVNALICCLICYAVYGFSWYALLFCLVYIGGVYILFVFVSVHSPNSSVLSYWNFSFIFSALLTFLSVWCGTLVYYTSLNTEFSSFICTLSEGGLYISMCLILLFGFFTLSLIMSVKINHYR